VLQIKADVLGMAVERLAVVETGCLGAALLAARGLDAAFPLEEMLRRGASSQRRFEPRPDRTAVHDERFAVYRKLYPSLQALHHRM
jgi:xylulokinase